MNTATCVTFLLVAALVPSGNAADNMWRDCLKCHQQRQPGIVRDWRNSLHARVGVGCASCHGTDHDAIDDSKGAVPASRCATCHAKQFGEFMRSRHAIALDRMKECGRYRDLPNDTNDAKCGQCHNVQQKCDSCHTRHRFNVREARKPIACGTCHMGPDHAQLEMYKTSKHGAIYATEGDTGRAPVCVTCHMPRGVHDVSSGLAFGPVGAADLYVGVDGKPISRERARAKRKDMEGICRNCHSPRFVTERLETADRIHRNASKVLTEAKDIIRQLHEENLLVPSVAQRLPHPERGKELVLGGPQLYRDTSHIERLFFKMYKYDYVNTWKGAYHFNPDYTHWYGWAELNLDLIDIKEEARKLRENARLRAKTGVPVEPIPRGKGK